MGCRKNHLRWGCVIYPGLLISFGKPQSSCTAWGSSASPLTRPGTVGSRPFPLPGQSLVLILPCPLLSLCCFVFVFLESCVCPPVLKAISIWVKHFETNQKPQSSSPAVSHSLFSTSLLFSLALSVNLTSSLWSPSPTCQPPCKMINAVCVLFCFSNHQLY